MRGIIALAATLLAGLIAATPASAGPPDPRDPCGPGKNPTTLCGDTIDVEVATTVQCPAGGIVIIVNKGKHDEKRFVVCNGRTGPAGPPGPPGPPGQPGQPGPQGPPGAPGDRINVVTEPAGANCPTGGVKVTVIRGNVDTVPPTAGDPADTTFYLCNGQSGPQGEPGEPGESPTVTVEPAGLNCPAGGIRIEVPDNEDADELPQVHYVCNGLIGPAGPAGPAGPSGPAGPVGPAGPRGGDDTCVSGRVAVWRIIVVRTHRVRGLRAWFEGSRVPAVRGRTSRGRVMYTVRLPLTGLRRGVYNARIRYRVSVNGGAFRRGTRVSLRRACYGNPRGGFGEGLNRFSIAVI